MPDAIADVKAKYAAERLKRLRSDGVRQYQTLSGEFAYLDKDPYTPDMGHRQPLEATNEVVLIGGGLTNVISRRDV